MRCTTCDQADRVSVRRAKLAERDGRIAVVLDVPLEECPACGARWLTLEVAEPLDIMLRRLIASGAETSTAHWDELTLSSFGRLTQSPELAPGASPAQADADHGVDPRLLALASCRVGSALEPGSPAQGRWWPG